MRAREFIVLCVVKAQCQAKYRLIKYDSADQIRFLSETGLIKINKIINVISLISQSPFLNMQIIQYVATM